MEKINKIDNNKDNDVASFIEEFVNQENVNIKLTQEDKEFEKYLKVFKEKFGRNAYIAEPSGTKEQTIEAIKVCLKKNKDILDKLLYPNSDKFIY